MRNNSILETVLLGIGTYFIAKGIEKNINSSQETEQASMFGSNNNYDWHNYIYTVASKYNIDPNLIKAIIMTESSGRPNAIRHEWNGHDSIGLMQVTIPAARDVGYTGDEQGLLNPITNIEYGTRYLKRLIDEFNGNIYWAVAAYNAGAYNVKHGRYSKNYVNTVFRYYNMFKSGYNPF